jgi:hypothetical protein
MQQRNILVVAVDGLRASALGAYGNTLYSTPALDHFAAESFLLDACFSPAADLEPIYRALWESRHPLLDASQKSSSTSLADFFAGQGYHATLVTDDEALLQIAGAADFHECLPVTLDVVKARSIAGSAENSRSLTAMSRLFESACELLAERVTLHQPHLLWIHSRCLYGHWEAPLDLQQSLLDKGDPPPIEIVEPPDFVLSRNDDPDTIYRYAAAYGAQVMLLDDYWNALMHVLGEGVNRWLVILIGLRGFPLGEHGRIGGIDRRMHVEQLHVPWLIRFPDGRGRLCRRQQLTTHLDVLPTLVEWQQNHEPRIETRGTGGEPPLAGQSVLPLLGTPSVSWRQALISASEAARSLRTPSWSLRQDAPADGLDAAGTEELYVRPDDRWEANDVAVLCPDAMAELQRLIRLS